MFGPAFFFQVLAASAAFAIPTSKEQLAQRVTRRAASAHFTSPNQKLVRAFSEAETDATHTKILKNWSGAVLTAGADTFKSITGTFTVPMPREPSGGWGTHSASAWVGIGGDSCGTILQTGVSFIVLGTRTSFYAWFEWFPDSSDRFIGFPVRPGNSITASVNATSRTGGTATIVNHSTGQQVSHTFSDQPALCLESAEWIVEDFATLNGLMPLADWGTVTFTNASAGTAKGSLESPSSATIINMVQNGRMLAEASASGDTVTVRYTGP